MDRTRAPQSKGAPEGKQSGLVGIDPKQGATGPATKLISARRTTSCLPGYPFDGP